MSNSIPGTLQKYHAGSWLRTSFAVYFIVRSYLILSGAMQECPPERSFSNLLVFLGNVLKFFLTSLDHFNGPRFISFVSCFSPKSTNSFILKLQTLVQFFTNVQQLIHMLTRIVFIVFLYVLSSSITSIRNISELRTFILIIGRFHCVFHNLCQWCFNWAWIQPNHIRTKNWTPKIILGAKNEDNLIFCS